MFRNLLSVTNKGCQRRFCSTKGADFQFRNTLMKNQQISVLPAKFDLHETTNQSTLVLRPRRLFTTSSQCRNADDEQVGGGNEEESFVKSYYDERDRTRVISPELSLEYMESAAYRNAYGDEPVWKYYRRNIKGGNLFIPRTRKNCIKHQRVQGASPCPICRDIYLVVDYRNIKLLQQFIDEYSGVVYDTYTTGVCQFQHEKLLTHIEKAKDYGLLDVDADQVHYDIDLYKR